MNLNKHRVGAYLKGSGKTSSDKKNTEDNKQDALIKKVSQPESNKSKPSSSKLDAPRGDDKPNRSDIAKYLMVIGREDASKILKHLDPSEVEAIVREIASIKYLSAEESQAVLERFKGLVKVGAPSAGGVDTARSILVQAFGEERGGQLMRQAMPKNHDPFFRFIQDYEPQQIAQVLRHESMGVKAIVLAYVPAAFAANILKLLPKEDQRDIVVRISRIQKVEKDVLIRIEEGLKQRIISTGKVSDEEIDGKSSLAAIMRHLDPDMEQRLVGILETEAPEIAEDIKERLFTVDSILLIDDRDFQKLLTGLENKHLATILKGKSDEIRKKIVSNVSENRAQLIAEEYQNLGAVRKKDVDEATRDFISWLRRLEQEGSLTLHRDDEEYVN